MQEPFRPPRGITGFNIDDTPTRRRDRTKTFERWTHALAQSTSQRATAIPSTGNYDIMQLEGSDRWLLHNHHVPLVGALATPPEAGFAYAVQCEFVPVDIPTHLIGWGPSVVAADELNRALVDDDWTNFAPPARIHADRFKPTTIGHILFNHWD